MGEIADGLINGDFDFYSGEYMGQGGGFPRTSSGELIGGVSQNYGKNPLKGIRNYFAKKGVKKGVQRELMIGFIGEDNLSNQELAERISNDWSGFMKYTKKKL